LDQDIKIKNIRPIILKDEEADKTLKEKFKDTIGKYFLKTIKRFHPVLDFITVSGPMFPRHAKWNVVMLNLLMNAFVNCLFLNLNPAVITGCGPDMSVGDEVIGYVLKQMFSCIATAIIISPAVTMATVLLCVDQK